MMKDQSKGQFLPKYPASNLVISKSFPVLWGISGWFGSHLLVSSDTMSVLLNKLSLNSWTLRESGYWPERPKEQRKSDLSGWPIIFIFLYILPVITISSPGGGLASRLPNSIDRSLDSIRKSPEFLDGIFTPYNTFFNVNFLKLRNSAATTKYDYF